MIIRRETLQAVLPATASGDTRYSLHAINVRPDGTVEATDGHIAIQAREKGRLPDEDFPIVPGVESFHGNPDGNVLIPVDVVKAMLGTMPKKTTLPILHAVQLAKKGTEGAATITATDLQAPRVAKIDPSAAGQYPSIDRVMPAADKPDTVELLLAADVLEVLCKAARAVGAPEKSAKAPILRFVVPFGASDRQKIGRHDGQEPNVRPLGEVISAVRVTVVGPDVELTIAAMPCHA
mgnify:CR=1 FL=1